MQIFNNLELFGSIQLYRDVEFIFYIKIIAINGSDWLLFDSRILRSTILFLSAVFVFFFFFVDVALNLFIVAMYLPVAYTVHCTSISHNVSGSEFSTLIIISGRGRFGK